jgi:DNA polymerase alpha subunit B
MTIIGNVVAHPYRWMDQKVQLRAEAAVCRGELLEHQIYTELEKLLAASESQDLQIFVGRVLSESSEEVKDVRLPINAHSIILEASTGRNVGKRVKLFVNDCPDYILYPSQIVGAIGRLTAAGTELHADRLVCGAPIPERIQENRPSPITAPVHVSIACGPYSPDNMLIFDSIAELEARIRSEHAPDALVLMGPFLDANHPLIASGIVMDSFGRPASFEDVYKEEIIPKLARLARSCENARTELYIVPSANEVRIGLPIPQPPIDSLKSEIWKFLVKELPPSVKYLSNPSWVRFGDVDMYFTSADVLSTLNANVLFKQGEQPLNRVDTCLDQFLRSRSVFPVNPSGLRIEPSERYRLNFEEARGVPDIIVSPSLAGKRFIKKVSGRVFVNPGFMSDATGTCSSLAELVIGPPSEDRVSGDVVKL